MSGSWNKSCEKLKQTQSLQHLQGGWGTSGWKASSRGSALCLTAALILSPGLESQSVHKPSRESCHGFKKWGLVLPPTAQDRQPASASGK